MSSAQTIKLERDVPVNDFRGAMRQLVGGVAVITVGQGANVTGMTVTSVSSLSVDPPSLIVSVNRAASSWPRLKRYGFFGVNVLSADQIEIAERFAGKGGLKGAERFERSQWVAHASGAPLLAGALAAIDCEIEDIVERYSHGIVIARVRHLQVALQGSALAYWRGKYVALDQDEDVAKLAAVGLPDRARKISKRDKSRF
jgi:flavin reductase (DIM6/NTAB) family NADH-FMN oxidoreductase RutF